MKWLRSLWARQSVRGFAHVLGGNTAVSFTQGLQFLLLARFLGPEEFGQLAAASGVLTVIMPFSGVGAGAVLVMRGARDPKTLPVYYGNGLATMVASGLLLVLLAMFGVSIFLEGKVPLRLMAVFGISELIANKVIDISWHVFLARDQLSYVSRFLFAGSVTRLAAAGLFVLLAPNPTAEDWVLCALVSNALVAFWVFRTTQSAVRRVAFDWRLALRELKTGAFFAISISAKGFYTDADKVLLARFATPTAVGLYTAAFRLVQISLVPIRAISATLATRLFRAGESGIDGSLRVVTRVLGPLVPAALMLGGLYYLTAPLLTWVAGDSYAESVEVMRVLCLLPLFQVCQSLLADTLNSSGHHRFAASLQAICAVLVCGLCVLLIPMWGWRGAAASSYGAQASLCVLLLCAIAWIRKSGAGTKQTVEPPPP